MYIEYRTDDIIVIILYCSMLLNFNWLCLMEVYNGRFLITLNVATLTWMPVSSDMMDTTVSLGCEHVVSIMPLLKFAVKILSLQVRTV
jgi:hypothetical protein